MFVVSGSAIYRILYEQVDESKVDILHVVSPNSEDSVDEFRYPRAGTSALPVVKYFYFEIFHKRLITKESVR